MVSISLGEYLKYATDLIVGFLKAESDKIGSVHELVDGMRDELELMKEFLYNKAEQEEDDASDVEGVIKVRRLREITFQIEDILDTWDLHQQEEDEVQYSVIETLQGIFSELQYKARRWSDKWERASFSLSCKSKHTTACKILGTGKAIKKVVGESCSNTCSRGRVRYYESIFMKQDSKAEEEELVTYEHHYQDPAIRPLYKDESELVGITDHRNNVTDMLDLVHLKEKRSVDDQKGRNSNGPPLVVVWGEPGVGKTTLVHNVFEDSRIKEYFPLRVWITATKCYKRVDLLKSLLKQFLQQEKKSLLKKFLRQEQAESEADAIAKNVDELMDNPVLITDALRKHLTEKERRRYILVLDEVSEMEELAKCMKAAFLMTERHNDSRILVTTSSQRIAKYWKTSWPKGKDYKLDTLSDEHANDLFDIKAFGLKNGCPWKLEEIKKDILKDCEGLPYLIEKVGVQFSTTDKWIELFHRFQNNPLSGEAKRAFFSRYHEMPSYLKQCFLYLGIFPKGYIVSRMRIVRLWIAEGFIPETPSNRKTPEEIAEDYLNELVERGMVRAMDTDQTGRNREIQLNRFWHQMVLSKLDALNFCLVLPQVNRSSCHHRHRRLSVHKDIEFTTVPNNVRSVLLFTEQQGFPNCGKWLYGNTAFLLKVLDLEGAQLDKVPTAVRKLHNLRYLSLRHTKVKKLEGFIGGLWNLQTLDLRESEVSELPKAINRLGKLRHLLACKSDLPVKIQDGVRLASFKDLQKLVFVDASSIIDNNLLSELKNLAQLRRLAISNIEMKHGIHICNAINQLKNLQALRLISTQVNGLDLDHISCDGHLPSQFPAHLERLYLEGELKGGLPRWVPKLAQLVKLRLKSSGFRRDPLGLLARLSALMVLDIVDYGGVELDVGYDQFYKLRVLRLRKLPNLNKIIVDGKPIEATWNVKGRDWSKLKGKVLFEIDDALN